MLVFLLDACLGKQKKKGFLWGSGRYFYSCSLVYLKLEKNTEISQMPSTKDSSDLMTNTDSVEEKSQHLKAIYIWQQICGPPFSSFLKMYKHTGITGKGTTGYMPMRNNSMNCPLLLPPD